MIGVVASASPELSGPQIAWTLTWLIISCVAFTALVGSPWVSRITISILRPLTPPRGIEGLDAEIHPAIEADGRRRTRAGHRRQTADLDRFGVGDRGRW